MRQAPCIWMRKGQPRHHLYSLLVIAPLIWELMCPSRTSHFPLLLPGIDVNLAIQTHLTDISLSSCSPIPHNSPEQTVRLPNGHYKPSNERFLVSVMFFIGCSPSLQQHFIQLPYTGSIQLAPADLWSPLPALLTFWNFFQYGTSQIGGTNIWPGLK